MKGKGYGKGKMFHGAGTKGVGKKAKQNSGSGARSKGGKKKMGRAGQYGGEAQTPGVGKRKNK